MRRPSYAAPHVPPVRLDRDGPAGIRLNNRPLEEVLQQFVQIAKDAVPGAGEVSNTLVRDDKGWTAAYTGRLALDADELQYERGYGPCMDAGRTGTVLLIDDTRVETRWPDYTAHVAARGVLSSLSVPLPIQTDVIGALNIYSREPLGVLPRGGRDRRRAGRARGGRRGERHRRHRGDDARGADAAGHGQPVVIDQAMGVIMAQNRCDADAAFAILTRASQNRNIKLREIARSAVMSVSRPPGS